MSECDRDISDIKNGTKNIQKRKLAKHIQEHIEDEAFDAFMEIFHPNKNIRIPTDEDYITEENKLNKKPYRNQFQKGKAPLAVPNSRVRKGADLPDESIAEERWVRPKYNFDSLPPATEEKAQNEGEEEPKKKKRGGGLGLMAKMEAAIDQETKKDEEKKQIQKEQEIKKQALEALMMEERDQKQKMLEMASKAFKPKLMPVREPVVARKILFRESTIEMSILTSKNMIYTEVINGRVAASFSFDRVCERPVIFHDMKEDLQPVVKENAVIVKAARQSNTFIHQKEAKMREEAAKMQKIREQAETENKAKAEKPPTPPPSPPKPRTPTPEPVKKPPTPKPPTPPPSPTFQWDNLEKYSHHPWFEPLKRHCQLKEIKIRQYDDFIPALVDLFICSCDISVKQNLLEAFSELIREEILDQPHLVRKVSLGVQNLVNSDELSQRHPIRKLGLDWLRITHEKSEIFGVEIINWLHHNQDLSTLHDLGLSDGADLIQEEITRWQGNVRKTGKKFFDFWGKRYQKATKNKTFNWKDCLKFYVDREREKRLNAARQVSNTVMEQNKLKEGALVRIGDLHTGRRFEAKKLMAKTPLPPLELRVRDPGEPKVIRLALKHNKILLAPMGRFWTETRETQSMMELAAKRRAQRKSEVDIITAQFQKFFCPENSYVHHTASDIY